MSFAEKKHKENCKMVCVGHHLWPTECGAQQSEGPIPMESPTSSLFAELRLGAGQRQQANHVARRDGSGSFSMDDDGWCSDRQKSHGAATTVAGPVRLAEAARSLFHQFSRTKRKTRLPRFHSGGINLAKMCRGQRIMSTETTSTEMEKCAL